MKKRYTFSKRLKTKKGFTLIELMVVVVIIGAVVQYIADEGVPDNNGEPENGWQDALIGKYLEEWPKPPDGSGNYVVVNEFADYRVDIKQD